MTDARTRRVPQAAAPRGVASRLLAAIEAWRRRPLAHRVALGVALLALAFGARVAGSGLTTGPVLPFLLPAVLLGSLLGRATVGIALACVAWAAAVVLFVEPIGRFEIGSVQDTVIAALLLVAAIGASLVIEILWLIAEEDGDGLA